MRFQIVSIYPIAIAPGETVIRRLIQPIDEDALIGHKQMRPYSIKFDDDTEHQIIAVEITAITQSGLPGMDNEIEIMNTS